MSLVQIGAAPAVVPRSPSGPRVHLFETAAGSHVFLVNGSRIFTVDGDTAATFRNATDEQQLIWEYGLDSPEQIREIPPEPPLRSLSLAVAQKCNLACSYCYAQHGGFGGQPRNMSADIADQAVDLLFAEAKAGERMQLTFLGGEPLINRPVIRRATERAAALALSSGTQVNFSITTNGTLLTPEDGEFFERFGFAVTVSLDGLEDSHDALRRSKSAEPTFRRIMDRVLPLLKSQARMQVSARVTVTALNLDLREALDELLATGFHSVGFSPLLTSFAGTHELSRGALRRMLAAMVDCGVEFERRTVRGERYAFLNMMNAMEQLHKGTHRPLPCGAGAGYFGVSATGELYPCHRFVEDTNHVLGDVRSGPARRRQHEWLADRHVDRQEPCRTCWARYLCGGGCHHEVMRRGRPACDFIRGWLHYCLGAYMRLRRARPDYFAV